MRNSRTTYAVVGLGSRSRMFLDAIAGEFSETSQLTALCDRNEGRLRMWADWARQQGIETATYTADRFDRMLAETAPDTVIVTTIDSTHDEYICRAM